MPVHRRSFSSPPSPDSIDVSCSSPIQLEQGAGWTLDHALTVASASFRRSLAESDAGRACCQGAAEDASPLQKAAPSRHRSSAWIRACQDRALLDETPWASPKNIHHSIFPANHKWDAAGQIQSPPPVHPPPVSPSLPSQQQDLVGEIPDQIV